MCNFESNFHTLKTVGHCKMECYFRRLAMGMVGLAFDSGSGSEFDGSGSGSGSGY